MCLHGVKMGRGAVMALAQGGKLAAVRAVVRSRPWRRVLNSAADLLFPPVCVNCQREIEKPTDAVLLCLRCRREFIDPRPSCPCCGAGLADGLNPQERCVHCRGTRFKFSSVIRLGDYDGVLQPAILAAKHSVNVALAMHLGRLLGETRRAELTAIKADVVMGVPAFWTRRSKHGHNSADALATEIARRLRVPVAEHLLVRTRATRPQTELTPPQRRANVRDAFAVRQHPDLPDANVLLVDDVLTTGSTANEAAKTLLKAGVGLI
jgi:ComF family protein